MIPQQQGNWFQSATPYGTLFHAELFPGKENSGKLVAAVRQQARTWAEAQAADLIISDGPPGIGCPVIAACTGVDLVLLVAEPSLAGRHDLARVLGVVRHFRIPAALCLNQADLYPAGAAKIRAFATAQGLPLLGEIPFDPAVPQAMLRGLPVTAAAPAAPAARAIVPIWEGIQALLANRLSII
jgi:MinD superfamily P-loop ATPase